MHRIFLLSPAKSSGRRAQLLSRSMTGFELAKQVQIGDATLGEVLTFCSGLYFRGKLTYARRQGIFRSGVHPSGGRSRPRTATIDLG
jgi:hypothetical protein